LSVFLFVALITPLKITVPACNHVALPAGRHPTPVRTDSKYICHCSCDTQWHILKLFMQAEIRIFIRYRTSTC